MAQRCTHCGRVKSKHNGPDGKYQACFAFPRVVLNLKPVQCPGCIYSGQPHLQTCKNKS